MTATKIDLTSGEQIQGTLPVARGGTGQTSLTDGVLIASGGVVSTVSGRLIGTPATAGVASGETTASTTYADLATTTDTVTVTIGSSGMALVLLASQMGNNGANNDYASFAASGANTISAIDSNGAYGVYSSAYTSIQASRALLLTGLSTGSTVFKMKYRVSGGTGTFTSRSISVIPL